MFLYLPLNISRRKKTTFAFAALTLLFLLLNSTLSTPAAPGDIDRAFGSGGITASAGTDFYSAVRSQRG
jgi:hypothetical protein